MAILAFVVFWLVLGLGVLFLAMSGGRKAARQRLQSRRGRRGGILLFLLALVGFGIAVPGIVIAGDKNKDSIPAANVSHLTDAQKRGRALFGEHCRICHTLRAANASASVGPNLDELRPPKALVLDAIKKGRANGNGNMAAQIVEGQDAQDVADFVAAAVGSK